jgi:P4 family phage/plasmid primase-like protien
MLNRTNDTQATTGSTGVNLKRQTSPIIEKLTALLPLGAVLLAYNLYVKFPTKEGWQKIQWLDTQSAEYQSKLCDAAERGGNIGVLLGAADLVTIDLDDDALIDPFLALNPKLRTTLRTRGARGCQIWMVMTGDYPKFGTHGLKRNGQAIGEWRCSGPDSGAQSVIWGMHPDTRKPYAFLVDAPAIKIGYSEIVWPEWIERPPHIEAEERAARAKERENKKAARSGSGSTPAFVSRLGITGDLRTLDAVGMLNELGCATTQGKGDKVGVECPWSHEHTTKDHNLDAAILPGEWPQFKCLHGHCAGRGLEQLCEWAEQQSPSIVNRYCRKAYTTRSKDEWPIVEGESACELHKRIGQVRCIGDDWFVVKGGVWSPTDRDAYRPLALSVLPDSHKTQARSIEVLKRLEGEQQVSRDKFCGASKFDGNGNVLLAVQNGVLRISKNNAELLPPDTAHGFTSALPVAWVDNAGIPLFYKTLETSLPDPADRELLLDVLSTALIPDARFEVALVMQGEAGTGKSTIIEPIAKIFGDAGASLSMADLCHPSGYKLSMLHHRLINLATELNTLEMDDSGLFKQLVSGERFTARPIYGKPFEMRSTATLVFLANSLPRFKHGTDAEVRRLRFVRFNQRVVNPDVTLKERIAKEAPGVFAELVRRAAELLAERKLSAGGKYGIEMTRRFSISNDPVGSFVRQCCVLGPTRRCAKDILTAAFLDFRDEHAISDKFEVRTFYKQLYERFDGLDTIRGRSNGNRVYTITGIDLLNARGFRSD